MLHLTLVRHASTALNEARRYQGWSDSPLSERGRGEALRLRSRLSAASFDGVLCSDLRRCRETLELALPGREPEVDARLRELDFGSWDGRTYDECLAVDAADLRAWIQDPAAVTPPGGEAFQDFCGRVDAALDALPAEGRVLMVIHGGPIRRILARALALEWRQAALMQLSACGLTRLVVHPAGGHLLCLNDTAHLEDASR